MSEEQAEQAEDGAVEVPSIMTDAEQKIAWIISTIPRQDDEKWPDYLAGVFGAYKLLTEQKYVKPPKLEVVK